MEARNKAPVPYEEALALAGVGCYTYYVMFVAGVVLFSSVLGIQIMSMVIPSAGCDLQLSNFEKGILTSMPYSGMIFSSFLFGFLADVYGRRKLILYCGSSNAIISILASFAPNSISLMVMWFVYGFVLAGMFTPNFVLVSEFCPLAIRGRSILVPSSLGSLVSVYLPAMAWFILPLDISIPLGGGLVYSSWRFFLALGSVPIIVSLILVYNLPESPKLDLNQGRTKETLETLRSIFAINNRKDKSEYPVENICLDVSDTIVSQNTGAANKSFLLFIQTLNDQILKLFSPPLLLYSVISCSLLFGVIVTYNTLYLWFPEQMRMLIDEKDSNPTYNVTVCEVLSHEHLSEPGSSCQINQVIFIIIMIAALIQTLLVAIVSCVADKIGRKLVIIIACAISITSLITLIYASSFLLTVISNGITVVILSTTFPCGLSIIVDYFPTSLRSTAASVTMVFARIGAAAGSQLFGAVFQTYCEHAYWSMVSLLAGTVVLCILIPTKRTM